MDQQNIFIKYNTQIGERWKNPTILLIHRILIKHTYNTILNYWYNMRKGNFHIYYLNFFFVFSLFSIFFFVVHILPLFKTYIFCLIKKSNKQYQWHWVLVFPCPRFSLCFLIFDLGLYDCCMNDNNNKCRKFRKKQTLSVFSFKNGSWSIYPSVYNSFTIMPKKNLNFLYLFLYWILYLWSEIRKSEFTLIVHLNSSPMMGQNHIVSIELDRQ